MSTQGRGCGGRPSRRSREVDAQNVTVIHLSPTVHAAVVHFSAVVELNIGNFDTTVGTGRWIVEL